MGQWLRICAPNAGGLGSISSQGTRSHMSQLKKMILHAAIRASQVALVVKNPPANSGDIRDVKDANLTPRSGRSPGRGHGNPVQYSCLENPMDRGAWRAVVHKVAQSPI